MINLNNTRRNYLGYKKPIDLSYDSEVFDYDILSDIEMLQMRVDDNTIYIHNFLQHLFYFVYTHHRCSYD